MHLCACLAVTALLTINYILYYQYQMKSTSYNNNDGNWQLYTANLLKLYMHVIATEC